MLYAWCATILPYIQHYSNVDCTCSWNSTLRPTVCNWYCTDGRKLVSATQIAFQWQLVRYFSHFEYILRLYISCVMFPPLSSTRWFAPFVLTVISCVLKKTILNIPKNEKHLTITSFRVHIFKDNEPSSCCLNKKWSDMYPYVLMLY